VIGAPLSPQSRAAAKIDRGDREVAIAGDHVGGTGRPDRPVYGDYADVVLIMIRGRGSTW
jgi:hypothetical protein